MYVSLYMCVYKQYSKVRQMVNFMHGSKGRGGGLQDSNLLKLNYETTKQYALDPSWQTQPLDTPPPFSNG